MNAHLHAITLAVCSLILAACASSPVLHTDLAESIRWYTGAAGYVDDERAHMLLERAAASQDTLAIMWIARVHSTGRMGFARDYSLAQQTAAGVIEEVGSLASLGSAEANFLMGTAYAEGLGKELNPAVAAQWYERAALMGNMLAQHNMGNIYDSGTGVMQDDARAVYWWRLAAEQGDAIPQFRLAVMYEQGRGVEQDLDTALRWYRDSAQRGYGQAQQALTRLERTN